MAQLDEIASFKIYFPILEKYFIQRTDDYPGFFFFFQRKQKSGFKFHE